MREALDASSALLSSTKMHSSPAFSQRKPFRFIKHIPGLVNVWYSSLLSRKGWCSRTQSWEVNHVPARTPGGSFEKWFCAYGERGTLNIEPLVRVDPWVNVIPNTFIKLVPRQAAIPFFACNLIWQMFLLHKCIEVAGFKVLVPRLYRVWHWKRFGSSACSSAEGSSGIQFCIGQRLKVTIDSARVSTWGLGKVNMLSVSYTFVV